MLPTTNWVSGQGFKKKSGYYGSGCSMKMFLLISPSTTGKLLKKHLQISVWEVEHRLNASMLTMKIQMFATECVH